MWILLDAQGNLRSSGRGEEPATFPSGWSLRTMSDVNMGDVYWDVPTQSFVATQVRTQDVVRRSLEDKADAALTSNQAFLADASVTNAEAVTQLQRLTRQVNALIRLAQDRLLVDNTDT